MSMEHRCSKHNWDTSLLELTYHSIDAGSEEYYCDVCEERRGKTQYGSTIVLAVIILFIPNAYIVGKYRIKFEKTYEFEGHPHPLTLVEKDKGKPYLQKMS